MELDKVLNERRSVRKYKEKKVSQNDIEACLEAAILAPSWKNSQVTRYHIARSEGVVEKIRASLPEFNQKNSFNAPVLIVTTMVKNRSGFERSGEPSNEVGNGWGFYDCGLHNMNLILKAQDLGLSTLVMGLRDQDKIREIMNITEDEVIVSVIALGYKDIDPTMPPRKAIKDIACFY